MFEGAQVFLGGGGGLMFHLFTYVLFNYAIMHNYLLCTYVLFLYSFLFETFPNTLTMKYLDTRLFRLC